MKGSVIEIDYQTAVSFLLPKHYSGRVPTISKAFAWYDCQTYTTEHLKAVCTFGKPASPPLCVGVCGKENAASVYELNRLCRVDDWDEPLSQFVSACLRRLRTQNWIIVSYSDTGMNHHGYIYQACNFLYTGCSKQRTDKYAPDGKHCRHYKQEEQGEYRRVRTAKHRYIYFCTYSKALKKKWLSELAILSVNIRKAIITKIIRLGTTWSLYLLKRLFSLTIPAPRCKISYELVVDGGLLLADN